ncbi:hypothetical protein BVRB_029770, partial [Beta vulgaris subsp. vulgaris]
MSTAIVDASNVSQPRAGFRRSSASEAFPPILTVNCVPVEKRSTTTAKIPQARVDTWRRRSCVSMLPRVSRGKGCFAPSSSPSLLERIGVIMPNLWCQ